MPIALALIVTFRGGSRRSMRQPQRSFTSEGSCRGYGWRLSMDSFCVSESHPGPGPRRKVAQRRADREIRQLTLQSIGVPSKYLWHEPDSAVEVRFDRKTKPRIFPLPSLASVTNKIPSELVGVWASRSAKFTRGAIDQGRVLYLRGNGSAAFIVAPPPIGALGTATYNARTFTLRLVFRELGRIAATEQLIYHPSEESLTGRGPDGNYTRHQSQVPMHIFED